MGELLARVDGLVASARRTAERLCASEGRFEASFEQAAVGMALVTPDGRWLRVNRKLCRILGYSPAELLARPLQDLSHPDELEADLGQVRRLLAGEIATYAMEKRATRKDGSGVWLHLTVTLVRRGDGLTVVAGYPWFTDWGRDTFIALRGLCLAGGGARGGGRLLAPAALTFREAGSAGGNDHSPRGGRSARPTASQRAMSVTYMRVRTTSRKLAPASCSACSMLRRHWIACA